MTSINGMIFVVVGHYLDGGGHPGTTFTVIYQIKAYYFSCSKNIILMDTTYGILRKPHVFMATENVVPRCPLSP